MKRRGGVVDMDLDDELPEIDRRVIQAAMQVNAPINDNDIFTRIQDIANELGMELPLDQQVLQRLQNLFVRNLLPRGMYIVPLLRRQGGRKSRRARKGRRTTKAKRRV